MQGFIIFDHTADFPKARKELAQWMSEGKLKRQETIVKGGLKSAEQALVDLYKGVNKGKLLDTEYFEDLTNMCSRKTTG